MVPANLPYVYLLRPEELLVESARERLITQAARNAAIVETQEADGSAHGPRDLAPAIFALAVLVAIVGWMAMLG